MLKGITRIYEISKRTCSTLQSKVLTFATKHDKLLKIAAINMPLVIAALDMFISSNHVQLIGVMGICWENDLREDIANAARQKILKKLTGMDEFEELIGDVEPSLRNAIGSAMAEISRLESSRRFDRSAFQKQQETIIEMIEKQVWQAIEPKIQDVQKKTRLKEWIESLKGQLKGIDEIQQRAAEILRENVREILYDFNGKSEDELGQGIPGEIEGSGGEKAMHELAETIVEKIMDRELDFDIAIGQVVSEIVKEGIIDAQGRERLVVDLLKASRSNDGTGLEKLFSDFRKTYLDPGAGTLRLPRETDVKILDQTKKATDVLTRKGGNEDAGNN